MTFRKQIGTLLLEAGEINEDQLDRALERQKLLGGKLGSSLIESEATTEDILGKYLAKQFDVPYISLCDLEISRAALEKVPLKTAEKHLLIPIEIHEKKKSITVVMADPTNLSAIDEIKFSSDCGKVFVGIAPEKSIQKAIRIFYHGDKNAAREPLSEIQLNFDPLPMEIEEEEDFLEEDILAEEENPRTRRVRKKILIVDGGPDRDLLDRYFRDKGMVVTPIIDPEQGLNYARESHYHAVILGDGTDAITEQINDVIRARTSEGVKTQVIQDLPSHIFGESKKYRKLMNAYIETLDIILALLEIATGGRRGWGHRVAVYSRLTALKMGFGHIEASEVMIASYLYDIYRTDFGKICHPTGPSEDEKIEPNRAWPTARILEQIDMPGHIREMIAALHTISVADTPDDLNIVGLPLGANIISMIDTFEDIVSRNPEDREDIDSAIEALRLSSGQLFDRRIVEHFCQVLQEERFLNQAGARQKQIAIIDDDPDTSVLLELRLVNEGFKVRIFDDSASALREFSTQPPNLVISEVRSERIDGFRFIKKLKNDPQLQDIPVFFISREEDAGTIMQGLNLGAEDYFIKPFNLEICYAKINKIMKKNRAEEEKNGTRTDGVTGSLKEMEFIDIVQILAAGMKTVKLSVNSGSQKGHVFLDKGKIVDARLEALEGEEAFYSMILWEEGTFTVHPDVLPENRTIEYSNDALLLEGCRRKDEATLISVD